LPRKMLEQLANSGVVFTPEIVAGWESVAAVLCSEEYRAATVAAAYRRRRESEARAWQVTLAKSAGLLVARATLDTTHKYRAHKAARSMLVAAAAGVGSAELARYVAATIRAAQPDRQPRDTSRICVAQPVQPAGCGVWLLEPAGTRRPVQIVRQNTAGVPAYTPLVDAPMPWPTATARVRRWVEVVRPVRAAQPVGNPDACVAGVEALDAARQQARRLACAAQYGITALDGIRRELVGWYRAARIVRRSRLQKARNFLARETARVMRRSAGHQLAVEFAAALGDGWAPAPAGKMCSRRKCGVVATVARPGKLDRCYCGKHVPQQARN